ncbi:transcription factor Dp-1 [Marchantia polymorpha subsp. ruderalis]
MNTMNHRRLSAESSNIKVVSKSKRKVKTKLFEDSPTKSRISPEKKECSTGEPESDDTINFGESDQEGNLFQNASDDSFYNLGGESDFLGGRYFHKFYEDQDGMISPINELLQSNSLTDKESSEFISPNSMGMEDDFQSTPMNLATYSTFFTDSERIPSSVYGMESADDIFLEDIVLPESHESMESIEKYFLGDIGFPETQKIIESEEEISFEGILLSEPEQSMGSEKEESLEEILLPEPEHSETIQTVTKKRTRRKLDKVPPEINGKLGGVKSKVKQDRTRGLRHISLSVTKKLETSGQTTYDEVADEVVADLIASEDQRFPHKLSVLSKNIRRRVYDTLNVLNAIGIICKKKQDVKWLGQRNGEATETVEMKRKKLLDLKKSLEMKRAYLQELETKKSRLENLVDRNQITYFSSGQMPEKYITLPFFLIENPEGSEVKCGFIAEEDLWTLYVYHDKSTPLPVHDDGCVLKALEDSTAMATNVTTDLDIYNSLSQDEGSSSFSWMDEILNYASDENHEWNEPLADISLDEDDLELDYLIEQ